MKNEFQAAMPTAPLSIEWGANDDYVTLGSEDIRRPWRSVHGFAVSAARLAAHQPLVLHCREDEIFDRLAQLNVLLGEPAVLNHAFTLLMNLKKETEEALDRLIELETQPIAEEDIAEIVETIEQFLTTDNSQTTLLGRLEEILTPNQAVHKKVGLQKMLDRLEEMIPTLAKVKDEGFRVIAHDRRRQPARPALEARRQEPILHQGQPTGLKAGFLLPPQHHLTLWAYVIVRSDRGQSAIWN